VTEHVTDLIVVEAENIIDLTDSTADQPSGPMEHGEPEIATSAEPTVAAESAEPTVQPEPEQTDEIDLTDSTDEAAEIDLAEEFEPNERPVAEPAPVEPPALDAPLRRVLEAVLLIAEEPLPIVEIATRLEVPAPEVEAAIHELAEEYEQQERGFALREIAGGWRYYTAAECAPEVERFLLAGQTSRLSQAALETLAVVAYQQPVSRSRIAAVRGVSVDGVIKTLVSRGLIAESGMDAESGAIMFVTTPKFLERLGLRDLSELPPLAPLLPGLDELPEE
jgi:segregation and condensation protein B